TPSEHSTKDDHIDTNVFHTFVEETIPVETPKANPIEQTSPNTSSDSSYPPGFEKSKSTKKDSSLQPNSEPSFPPGFEKSKSTKKDSSLQAKHAPSVDGLSVINELSRIIEVIGATGYNVIPCHKAIQTLIRDTGEFIVDQ
ncbi:hypothetical protein Tco_0350646, partial [Tanacetum coccineum]